MPPSRSHKQRGSRRGAVMPAPVLEEIPDGEGYAGGSLMVCYKDSKGISYKDLFYPNDVEAYNKNLISLAKNCPTELYGPEGGAFLKYESFDPSTEVIAFVSSLASGGVMFIDSLIITQQPPDPHDRHLYRTFEFSPSLWIRVWDAHIAATPNERLEIFGLDIVDVSGHPQVVNTCIKVIVGARPGYAPEKEGNVITALDDIGVRMDRFDGVPSRYVISAGFDYIFEDGRHTVVHCFHHNLLNEPAPERQTHQTRTESSFRRSRSVG
ncbi:hypothetical protein IW261DRAFT_1426372 [Armillaria novae-zelandiae]|uniref:Uncharacterized protein n=1 Tax=Armillaria novae-zelandiae TaxID=153914 RepID=A0AA39NNA9_9AGAR|nr:hypothetical protein IW261DRAFT_1426372 [Armillaria novae-zelandiae]